MSFSIDSQFILLKSLHYNNTCCFKVVSDSMEPTIMMGDVVEVKKVPIGSIKRNDIIVFFGGKIRDKFVVHRCVKKVFVTKKNNHKLKLLTKGDNLNCNDPWFVTEENLIGKLIKIRSKNFNKFNFKNFINRLIKRIME